MKTQVIMRAVKKHAAKQTKPRQSITRLISPKPSESALSSGIFREVLETIDVGVAASSPEGKILWANQKFAEVLGIVPSVDPVGLRVQNLITPHSWHSLDAAFRMAENGPTEGEMRIISSSRPRKIRLLLNPVAANGQRAIQIVVKDVTKSDQASQNLKDTEASLHTLSGRLLRLQDEERRRIARDLHDITGQELAVVVMSLSHLARTVGDPGVDTKKQLTESVDIIRKVEQEIRTLSYLLHPPLLDELGLVSALKWYVEGFNKRTGLDVTIDAPAKFDRLAPEKETALFRVVQESLTNVLRHSGSHRAHIELCVSEDDVQISIEDHGKGVSPEILKKLNSRKEILGVGIPGIRERLRQFGGSLRVHSGRHGTLLVAAIPISKEESAKARPLPPLTETREEPPSPSPAESTVRKRILVVDDHEMIRHGIRSLLAVYADLEICGEAGDGVEAIAKAKELHPDLIIMDLSLPRVGGLAAAHQIRTSGNPARILIFTTHDFEGLEVMAQSSGSDGVVLKRKANHDLVRGVRAVLSGRQFFSNAKHQAASA